MKIKLSDLKLKQDTRPSGYYDEVVSKGKVEGNILVIEGDAYMDLVRKYSPTAQPKGQIKLGGCGGCGGNLKMPSIATMAKNAAGSAIQLASNIVHREKIMASNEKVNERQSICDGCEFWSKNNQRCSICGCYTKIKISLENEKCPKGKW